MTVVWLGGTGFEMGTVPVPDSHCYVGYGAHMEVATSPVKTGTYALHTHGSRGPLSDADTSRVTVAFDVTGSPNELYVGVWMYPDGNDLYTYRAVQVVLSDDKIVEIRLSSTDWKCRLYVDGVSVVTGTAILSNTAWAHMQVMFNISDTGAVQTMVDGTVDIDYSGDTKPGSSAAISHVQIRQQGCSDLDSAAWCNWDNLYWCTGGWGGDIRFDYLLPNSDNSIQWSPYPVGTSYTSIDERPAGDTDYIYTETSGCVNTHGLQDWSGSAKTPQFLNAWARATKITASVRGIMVGVESNGYTSTSGSMSLGTSYLYFNHVVALDPDGDVVWTDEKIDAALIRLESV